MNIEFSPAVAARNQGGRSGFSVRSIDLNALGQYASPVAVFDDFRVSGRPFGPHPHAGFSAVTYVFEDSQASLRSRDSLGNDAVVGPGGICWTMAGSGVIHEETPAEAGRELHGLQVFVNLSRENKLASPKVARLDTGEVPEWRNEDGDRVRVVAGSFEDVVSPLVPPEPFMLLDLDLRREVFFELEREHNALVYVLSGRVVVCVEKREEHVESRHALGLHASGGGRVHLDTRNPAHVVVLSGVKIRDPVVVQGPFIMNERVQIDAAVARFRRGEMGLLAPRTDV